MQSETRRPGGGPQIGLGLPAESSEPLGAWRFLRAVVISLLLTPIMAYWGVDEPVDIMLSLLVPPVSALLVLTAINLPLRRYAPRLAFTTGELILTYGMLATACGVGSEWMWCMDRQKAGFALFANETNQFETLLLPHLPPSLFFTNPAPLQDFKSGGHGWDVVLSHLDIWYRPILVWTFLVSSLCLSMISICSLMRRQWTERERLAFPIIQLPYAIVTASSDHKPAFWREPALWIAFATMGLIDLFNGLHFFWPSVPLIKVRFLGDMNNLFHSHPWNSTGWTPVGLFPFIFALVSFLPTDLVFSMVFFFFARKAQQIVAAAMGYPQGVFGGGYLIPAPPYFGEQTWGAFLALFVTLVWNSREHLKQAWRRVLHGGGEPGDVTPRWAMLGLLAGIAGMMFIANLAGLKPWFGLVYILLYLAWSTALTRMRAELGPPTHEMAFTGPNQLVVDFMGSQGLSARAIVGMSTTFYFFNRIHRSHPMPGQLEAMKIGERDKVDQRWIFAGLLVACVAGCIAAHVVTVYLGYRWGAYDPGTGQSGLVNNLLNNPRRPNPTAMGFVGLGFLVVVGLNFVRFRVASFWLHPVGYALAMNFGVDYFWFGMILAMVLKWGVLRIWGLRGYRKLHAAMIGIMLAEYAAETIWSPVAMIWRIPTYSISINGRLGWNQ